MESSMTLPQSVESMYKESFFKNRHKLNWRAPIVCKAISEELSPKSVIDVGCATGDLVAEFVKMGIQAFGLEGSTACLRYLECSATRLFFFDLRRPLPRAMSTYDLAICFEVAEHIEPQFARQFLENLCALSDRVLISAAPPGQGGHHHVNCQSPEYWEYLFKEKRYLRSPGVEERLKMAWEPWKHKPGIKAYYQNLLHFERISPLSKGGVGGIS